MTRLFWRFSPILGKILAQKGAIWCDKCHCYHGSGINKGTFLDAIIPPSVSVHSVEYCKILLFFGTFLELQEKHTGWGI